MTSSEKFRRIQETAIPLGIRSHDDIQDSLEKDLPPIAPHLYAAF